MSEKQTTLPLVSDATLPDAPQTAIAVVAEPVHYGLSSLEGDTGLEMAVTQAKKLMHVVREKGLVANIQNKDYLTVEAWCVLGMWNGVTPRTAWTREIRDKDGKLEGVEARVEAVRHATMDVVGAAEACCYFTEKKGNYARWKDAHAVRAMAQTRATSRALAQIFRFIPVLEGYSGTPAEDVSEAAEPHDNPTPREDVPTVPPRGQRTNPIRDTLTPGMLKGLYCEFIGFDRKTKDQDAIAEAAESWARFKSEALGKDVADKSLTDEHVRELHVALEKMETERRNART